MSENKKNVLKEKIINFRTEINKKISDNKDIIRHKYSD